MKIHSLDIKSSYDGDFDLIGIHTYLEDFKLAYLLNDRLNAHFHKAPFSLDIKSNQKMVSFSIYNQVKEKDNFEWYLIANTYTEEKINPLEPIVMITETKTYLIPEKKNVDYFIKIIGKPTQELIRKIIHEINQINQIVTSYIIETKTLKSKQCLTF